MRLLTLDGWRGVLSLFIVLGHFPGRVLFQDTEYFVSASVFVDMFFIFSGFVIVAAYERKLAEGYGVRRFLVERLGRIYPIHFVVLLLFIITEVALVSVTQSLGINERGAFSGDRTFGAIISNLFLVQSLNIHDGLTWNFPAWSLSTEWSAYVVFALCMLLWPRRFWPFALTGAVMAPVLLHMSSDQPMQATFDYGAFRSFYGFSLGALTYYAYRWIKDRKADERVPSLVYSVFEAAAIVLIFAMPAITGPTRWALITPPIYAAILLIFAIEGGVFSRIMQSRALVYLGTISLSIYIIHIYFLFRLVNVAELVQWATGWQIIEIIRFGEHQAKFLNLPGVLLYPLAAATAAFIILVSHFTHRFVEVPGERMFRRWAKRFAGEGQVVKPQLRRQPV